VNASYKMHYTGVNALTALTGDTQRPLAKPSRKKVQARNWLQ